MVGVLFSLDSNHGLGFGEVQLPIPKRQSLAKGQVNVKHIFGNFGSKLLPFVNICIGLLHYFTLIYETMLLQLSMFHKIPKIKNKKKFQFKQIQIQIQIQGGFLHTCLSTQSPYSLWTHQWANPKPITWSHFKSNRSHNQTQSQTQWGPLSNWSVCGACEMR